MKGMQRISRGSGFRGALDYAFYDKESPGPEDKKRGYDGVLIGGNMAGMDPRELAAEFKLAQQMRPDIEKKVWHQSLRLPEGDKMSPEEWAMFADDYMRRMGFNENHQRAYILHDDPKGQHIHIIASRVDLEGNVNVGHHESLQSTSHLQAMEKEYGLTITKGPTYTPDGKLEMPDVRGPSKNEIEMGVRTGEKPARMQLQDVVSQAMKDGPTIRQFVERLEAADVKVVPNVTASGKMNGFAFELEGVRFKGSDLGKSYTWNGLQKGDLDYDKDRDTAFLADLRARAGEEPSRDAVENAGAAAGVGRQPESVLEQPAAAGVDARADAGPAPAIEPVQRLDIESQPEPRLEPRGHSEEREVAIERDKEPAVDTHEARRGAEPTRRLDAVDRSQPSVSDSRITADNRPSARAIEIAEVVGQMPAADRRSVAQRIVERMRELAPAANAEQRSILMQIVDKLKSIFGIKKTVKEPEHGRDRNGPARSIERDVERAGLAAVTAAAGAKPEAGAGLHPGSGAKPALGSRPGGTPAGRRAHAEPRHRTIPGEDRLPAGQAALLRDRMYRLSYGDMDSSWRHAKSALFQDVRNDLDKRRAHGPDRLLSTRGSASAAAVTPPAASAPIAAPSPIAIQKIEPTKPVEKPKTHLDDAERRTADAAERAKAWLMVQQKKSEVPEGSTPKAASVAPVGPTGQPTAVAPAAIDDAERRRANMLANAKANIEAQRVERERLQRERLERERIECERLEREKAQLKKDDERLEERRRDDRRIADARRVADKAIASGKGKSDALHKAVDAGDIESVDRLLDHGAAVKPDSLETAAKSDNDAMFKKLVGASAPQDHSDLKALARESGPVAREKLEALAAQAKAQGGHIAGLGIDGPAGFKTESDFKSSPAFPAPKW